MFQLWIRRTWLLHHWPQALAGSGPKHSQTGGAELQMPCLTCRHIQEEEDGALVGLLTSQGATSLWGGREGDTAGESNRSLPCGERSPGNGRPDRNQHIKLNKERKKERKSYSLVISEYQVISSVVQLCVILCDPMDCSTPGLPVHHQLPEFTQTHVHWVGDAIQPSHPLLSPSPSPSAFNLSQRQGLFKWVSSPHEVAKVLEFQLQHQSLQWTPSTDFL